VITNDLQQVGSLSRVIGIPPSNKTDSHDITEILLKVALNSMTLETNTTISILCIYPKEV
jgi:uncharacterized protein (DUF2384 family)